MRQIRETSQFRKSLKRLSRSGKFNLGELKRTINILAAGEELSVAYNDHELSGALAGYRECHLKFDLLLVYKIETQNLLVLVDLGSHSDLFG